MGLSPSVSMTILRVQDFFFPRYLSCVWIPTIIASMASEKKSYWNSMRKKLVGLTITDFGGRGEGLQFGQCRCIGLGYWYKLRDMFIASLFISDNIFSFCAGWNWNELPLSGLSGSWFPYLLSQREWHHIVQSYARHISIVGQQMLKKRIRT